MTGQSKWKCQNSQPGLNFADTPRPAVNAFVSLKEGFANSPEMRKSLTFQVRKSIGPFAAPKAVYVVDDLPKTRSGKIMRRILRKTLSGEEDQLGDISTVSYLPHTPRRMARKETRGR